MKKIYSLILNTACMLLCFAFAQNLSAQAVTLTYTSGIFDNEVSWQLVDVTDNAVDDCYALATTGDYANTVVQNPGNSYAVRTWESFGDNWDGSTLTAAPTGGNIAVCTAEFQFQCDNDSPGYDSYVQAPSGNGSGACGATPAAGGQTMYAWTAIPPACQLVCPGDMTVNTAPGICESAFLTIATPTFNPPGCGSSIPAGSMTVDGPTTPLNFNALGLITTPFQINGVSLVPPAVDCITEVCFDVTLVADVGGAGFEQTNIRGEGGVILGLSPNSAGDCNTAGGFESYCVPVATYNAWAADGTIDLSIDTDADIDNICASSTIQASVTTPTACVTFANDYNGTADASDTYPLGCTTVTFMGTEAASGDPISCQFEICVEDNEDPVLNCPGDITFNLQGGECSQIYNFDVTATDNCGLAPANIDPPVEYGGAFGGIEDCPGQGQTLACSAGATSQVQEIDVSGFPSNFILTDGCFIWDNTAWGMTSATINFYCAPAGLTAAAAPLPCTLTDTPVATSGLFDLSGMGLTPGTAVCIPVQDVNGGDYVYDPACGGLYMEIVGSGTGHLAFNGNACNGITATGNNTYLCSPACGSGYYSQFGFAIDAFFAIQGSSFDVFAPADPPGPGINEYASGDVLPIGEHCFSFLVQDVEGNTATCGWCVTVNEFPEDLQVTSLACNDLVNVSLDEGCMVTIGADMFLEGGPYGCYETDYTVEVEGFSGDQNLSSIPLECGETYTVTVTDVDTGVSCWGEMFAEDKINPVVIPPDDITLNCLQSVEPGESVQGVTGGSAPANSISWGDFTTGLIGTQTIQTAPATTGAIITNVTVDMQMSHSWIGDLDIFLEGPDGTTVQLINSQCVLQDNINATFDESGAPIGCAAAFSAAGHENCNMGWATAATISGDVQTWGGTNGGNGLNLFNGMPVGGDFTLTIFDNVGGDGGCLENFSITVEWECPAAAEATIDNACGGETLTYTDQYFDNDCDGSFILRTWIATDECGNSGTATSNIFINQVGADGLGSEWFWPENPIDLTCDAASTPDDIYNYFSSLFAAQNPQLPNWIANPDEFEEQIAEWQCNVNAAGVRRAYPYYFNKKGLQESFIQNNCNMLFTYDDLVLPACGSGCVGNSKIIRTWTALDWCTAETRTAVQVIHAKDNEAPTFDLESSLTVSASPWNCAATFYLPIPEHLHDDCSSVVTYRVYGKPGTVTEVNAGPYFDAARGQWRVDGLPKAGGPHEYIYEASDCCGNLSTQSLFVTVVDGSAPIAVAKQNIVISLTSSPTDPDGGLAKLYVQSVDNGSHDGDCGPVRIAVRRTDDVSCGNWGDVIRASTGERHNNNSTFFNFNDLPDNQQPADHDSDDTDEGEYVKFCCEDLTGPNAVDEDGDGVPDYAIIEVELGVWDDANMDGIPGTPGDLFGLTWANVRVEAKLQPQLICPPKAMITCDMDETDDFVIDNMLGRATASSTCGALNTTYEDICGLDLNQNGVVENFVVGQNETFFVDEEAVMWDVNGNGIISSYTAFEGMTVREDLFVKACHYGPMMRVWSIEGTSVECTQIIIISEPTTTFDGDTQIDWPYSRNEFINLDANDGDDDCNGDGRRNDVSSSDITLLPDGAPVPTYAEVKMDCIDALCEEPAWVDATCSLIGWTLDSDTFYFEGDACRKIINTYTVIDWCQYELGSPSSPGIWTWTVIGKLVDPYAPLVEAEDDMFPAVPGTGGSGTGIDESACVGVGITMSATATDRIVDVDGDTIDNACPSQWLKWNVYLDINNDWVYEREWSSFVAEDRNTSTDPLWSEDNAADNIAAYGYPIPDVRVGNTGGVDNAEDFATAPGFEYTINIPDQIPADCGETQHRVVWKAYDGCGNVTSVTSYFTVQDKKAPTPYCINLSTALMADPDGENGPLEAMVELWAIDFDAGSFDNCTEYENLRFTFTDTAPELDPDFNEDLNSSAKIFVCDDLNGASPAFLTLPIYVWDECGNYDFCLVNLRLVDNQGGCVVDTTGSMIAGNIHTSFGEMIENVQVMNETYIPELTDMKMTDASGDYMFEYNSNNYDYEISGSKNDDYLNGVSTLDLVLIQRHILGIQDLNDPYLMIAADVNNDNEITALDLIELRKLILGIYDELPNNSSWRFGDANQVLNVANPWSFDETLEINNLSTDMMHEDFVGVKIGDVNNSVQANQNSNSTEVTSSNRITIEYNDRDIAAGELVELTIGGADLTDVYGYQFTMNTDGLELVNVESGAINVSEENFGAFGNVVTTSWNSVTPVTTSDALFTMTFRSAVSGRLSDIINVNSEITKAEAYVGTDLKVVDINVDNNVDAASFALYQNEPNPFTSTTVIGFVMPEAADATLTVYDVTGKVIKLVDGNYTKGYNEIELSKSDLGAAGVLYYQLDSGDFTATKKMIIIE